MNRLQDKRIAVIGAGSVGEGWGNGKAAAVGFAREGARVLCVDRDQAAAEETSRIIESEGSRAAILPVDMTDPEGPAQVARDMQERWGGIDVLHFNIGISKRGGVLDSTLDDWQAVFNLNLTAAFLTTKAVLPMMRMQESGAFVFVSSLAAVLAGPYAYVSYEASKAALCRFAQSVAKENAPYGIRANTILPGVIDTPHVAQFVAPDTDADDLSKQRAALVPMGRQGSAWDIAHAAIYLASDEAGFVTGINLPVDGGMTL
ncbi:MAG: SDR family NAD(P)-dependent oxidoreductase [Pseudomonadota bacterium]